MTGLRYSPLHVTELCGEMQGKYIVGRARLTRENDVLVESLSFLSIDSRNNYYREHIVASKSEDHGLT